MDELLLYPERAAPLANTSSYKSGVGLTILQDNLCESDFSENDGNSTVSDEMNRCDNSSRHTRTEDASIMSLSNEGVEYARQFAENMIHHFNANEPKIALTKIREAFEGTYNKKVEQESDGLKQLISMGFSEIQSKQMLEITNGDIQNAIALLTS